MHESFTALVATEPETDAAFVTLGVDDLDDGSVTIAVAWSGLNYKDALAVTGTAPVVRRFPMVCGIDLGGTVVASDDPSVAVGTAVVVTGCGIGERHFGGYAPIARVPGSWCVPLPVGLTLRHAMVLGTAGVTAMQSYLALERAGSGPGDLDGLPLLVTGANGGVGSLAVLLGASLGYEVWASTGRPEETAYLSALGTTRVIDRHELSAGPVPALGKVRFGAAIDVVGGVTLANVLAQTRPSGAVAASGLVGGSSLPTTVHPFILRGVTLAGVNSVELGPALRATVWSRLATAVSIDGLEAVAHEVPLTEVPVAARAMLAGQLQGRTAVAISSEGTRSA